MPPLLYFFPGAERKTVRGTFKHCSAICLMQNRYFQTISTILFQALL